MTATLTGLFVHPVKSLAAIEVEAAEVTPRGLRHDRRFMVVDPAGTFITQRELGTMARLVPRIEQGELCIAAPDGSELRVPLEPEGAADCEVTVWRDRVAALDVGDSAARFLRAALGRELRLVYMPERVQRPVDPDYARGGEHVGFADGFPFLFLSQASVDDLSARTQGGGVSVRRFRPNLLIGGTEPYAEDVWDRVRVGGVGFRLVKPCSRCVITSLDPERGEPRLPNPLTALARFRRMDGAVFLGQNALLDGAPSTLRVGDAVEVLGTRPAPQFDAATRAAT